jgi:hypothetical protein
MRYLNLKKSFPDLLSKMVVLDLTASLTPWFISQRAGKLQRTCHSILMGSSPRPKKLRKYTIASRTQGNEQSRCFPNYADAVK